MITDENIRLAQRLGEKLVSLGRHLATAESCTGGLLAAALTAVPGSSKYFERGFVTYCDQAKNELLGVSLELLTKFSAVSYEVARAMAEGAEKYSHADLTIAITGYAGPAAEEVALIGTVYFAVNDRGAVQTFKQHFDGDRTAVRQAAVNYALCLLLQQVEQM